MTSYFKFSLLVLLFVYAFGSKAQTYTASDSGFVKFNVDARLKAHADAEITTDKPYIIKLPNKWRTYETSVGGNFMHIFRYKNHEAIISIYVPNFNRDTIKDDQERLKISRIEFEKLINQHNLDQEVRERSKILKGRFFAVKAIRKENFYVFYLNIKSKDVRSFNYAIRSIELK